MRNPLKTRVRLVHEKNIYRTEQINAAIYDSETKSLDSNTQYAQIKKYETKNNNVVIKDY
jgi:hypothetical protein